MKIKDLPLTRLFKHLKWLNEYGYNIYIEGTGDGNNRLIVEEKEITILDNQMKGGLKENGK